MTTSLFAANFLCSPLRQFAGALARLLRATPASARGAAAAGQQQPAAAASTPRCSRPVPLRVVRVLEGSCAAAGAGRMVISGRMADVCAELERLAALEAAAG